MKENFLFNGSYGDLAFDVVRKLVQENKNFDEVREEILSVADSEIADSMRSLCWWIVIKRMMSQKVEYSSILAGIESYVKEIDFLLGKENK